MSKQDQHKSSLSIILSLSKLIFYVAGIYSCYLFYGIYQEKIFRYKYIDSDGNVYRFDQPLFIINLATLFSMIIAYPLKILLYNQWGSVLAAKPMITISLFQTVTMFSSNLALTYVSGPIQALFKSAKVMSVMLVSIFLGRKFGPKQQLCATLVSVGILTYSINEQKKGSKETSIIGIGLLIVSLVMDGLMAEFQNKLRDQHTNLNSFDLQFEISKYTFIGSSVILLLNDNQFQKQYLLAQQYPQLKQDLMLITLCSSVGQCFIYLMMAEYGSFKLSIVTTTRKFFTVIASIVYFSHPLNHYQYLSLLLVFVGVSFEFLHSYQSKYGKTKTKAK